MHFIPIDPNQAPKLLELIRALEKEEGFPYPAPVTVELLQKNLLSEDGPGFARFIMVGEDLVGYIVYFYTFSTALGKKGIHLDDLYILPEHRKKGLGLGAMKELARIAKADGCGRIEWWAMRWNEGAVNFYKTMDVQTMDDVIMYRLEGEKLEKLSS